MCAKNNLLIFSSFLDIWENVEWPRFFLDHPVGRLLHSCITAGRILAESGSNDKCTKTLGNLPFTGAFSPEGNCDTGYYVALRTEQQQQHCHSMYAVDTSIICNNASDRIRMKPDTNSQTRIYKNFIS